MNKREDDFSYWQNTILPSRQNRVIEEVAEDANTERLIWFWEHTTLSSHQDKIIEGVVARADYETLIWFWEHTTLSSHQDKIIEGVAARADYKTLIWFWEHTTLSSHQDKIIEGVVARADYKTLLWFWEHTTLSSHQDKIINAINVAEVNQNNRIIQKFEKHDSAISEGNSMSNSFENDVFICHASEDKESFVSDLAVKLRNKGFKVWYDDFTLLLGDSLRRRIDQGLAHSRYGVVVLSKKFFEKEWPQKELDGLVARENVSDKVILPIWHNITKKEVTSFSPMLADRLAVSSDKGMDYVVQEITKVLKKNVIPKGEKIKEIEKKREIKYYPINPVTGKPDPKPPWEF